MPLFKTASLSETDDLPDNSKYIRNALTRKVSHDPTLHVYQDDTNGCFKIGGCVLNITINTCLWMTNVHGKTTPNELFTT